MFGDVAFAQAPFASLGGNTYDVSVAETGVVVEATDALFTAGGTVAETLQAQDSTAAQATFAVVREESAAAAIAVDTLNNIFNAAVTASANASAASSAIATMFVYVDEAVSTFDEQQAIADFVSIVLEAAVASETYNGAAGFNCAVVEAAAASSGVGRTVSFAGSVSEAVGANSELSVLRTANARVVGIQLYVSASGAIVWAVIDDSQTANWQNVATAQSAGWADVNNTQTPGWDDLPS